MNTRRLRNLANCLALTIALLSATSSSFAQDLSLKPEHVPPDSAPEVTPVEEEPSSTDAPKRKKHTMWRNIGLGTAGVATAYVAHEMGHVLTNLVFGNVPTLSKTSYGPIPFFTIDPGISCTDSGCFKNDGSAFKPGRTGKYFIVAAGFLVQDSVTEAMLSHDPRMRFHYAPFQKGFLLFSTALSFGYALSAWTGLEPPTGDIDGMSNAAQINKNVMAVMVALPAIFDFIRYMRPDWRWAPWVGRVSKVALVGVAVTF